MQYPTYLDIWCVSAIKIYGNSNSYIHYKLARSGVKKTPAKYKKYTFRGQLQHRQTCAFFPANLQDLNFIDYKLYT